MTTGDPICIHGRYLANCAVCNDNRPTRSQLWRKAFAEMEENNNKHKELENELERWARYFTDEFPQFRAEGCPACTYENGVFIRYCALHKRIDELEKEVQLLRDK